VFCNIIIGRFKYLFIAAGVLRVVRHPFLIFCLFLFYLFYLVVTAQCLSKVCTRYLLLCAGYESDRSFFAGSVENRFEISVFFQTNYMFLA